MSSGTNVAPLLVKERSMCESSLAFTFRGSSHAESFCFILNNYPAPGVYIGTQMQWRKSRFCL